MAFSDVSDADWNSGQRAVLSSGPPLWAQVVEDTMNGVDIASESTKKRVSMAVPPFAALAAPDPDLIDLERRFGCVDFTAPSCSPPATTNSRQRYGVPRRPMRPDGTALAAPAQLDDMRIHMLDWTSQECRP